MFMYAVKKPAAAAAAALGEGPGLLFASARGETPDAGITTAIFNDVEKGDIHDGGRWFPGAGSIAEVVFDMPAPLGNFRSGGAGGALETTPAYAIKYLVCDSGLSDEELGAFLAAGGAEPYNGSDYLEAFQSIAGVEIERPERPMYGGPSAAGSSRTACASRAPSGRHRTPSSTCSASSGSSARMSA